MQRRERPKAAIVIGLVSGLAPLFGSPAAHAAWSFTDEFNGGYNAAWTTVASPVGLTGYTFESVAGAQTLRKRASGLDGNTAGLQSAALLAGSVGSVEVRFNTVTQDLNRIDGLLQLSLQSQTNPGTFLGVDFFGGSFSTHRTFNAFGPFVGVVRVIDNGVGNPGAYDNNTWYRFRIDSTASTLTGSLLADDSSLIASYTFPYALSTLGDDFRVRIAQFGSRQQDVAVDWIRVVPAPGAAAIVPTAGILTARRRRA